MKALFSALLALMMIWSVDLHGVFVQGGTGPNIALVAKSGEECQPPDQETWHEEGGIGLEADPVAEPPVEARDFCPTPTEETQPEEGTIDLEGEGVACPPPCEPAPISEEPEIPEETIDREGEGVTCPPPGEAP